MYACIIIVISLFSSSYGWCGQMYEYAKEPVSEKRFIYFGLFPFLLKDNATTNMDAVMQGVMFGFLRNTNKVKYYIVNVCEGRDLMIEAVLSIILQQNSTKPIAVCSYVSTELTLLASSLISATNIIYFPYFIEYDSYPTAYTEFPNILPFKETNGNKEIIIDKFVKEGLRTFGLVEACEKKIYCRNISVLQYIKENKICFKQKTFIDPKAKKIKDVYEKANRTDMVMLLYIAGSPMNFYIKYLSYGTEKNMHLKLSLKYFQVVTTLYQLCEKLHKKRIPFFFDLKFNISTCASYSQVYWSEVLVEWFSTPMRVERNQTKSYLLEYKALLGDDNINYTPLQNVSTCKIINCKAGFEKTYGLDPSNSSSWDIIVGWYCQPCENNFFKNNEGYHQCIRCPDKWKSNEQKTGCIDTYKTTTLGIHNTIGKVYIVATGVSGLIVLIVIVIFIIKRNTPIVSASDKYVVLWQILISVLLNAFLACVPFLKTTTLTCTIKPIVIGLLLTLSSALISTKTQKILVVFKSKIKMNSNEGAKE